MMDLFLLTLSITSYHEKLLIMSITWWWGDVVTLIIYYIAEFCVNKMTYQFAMNKRHNEDG